MKTYEDGLNEKTYEDGLNEAWEAARKIGCADGYKREELDDIFGNCSVTYIFGSFTASEAIKQVKEYEEKQEEIKVGDEVTDYDGWDGVVTWIDPDGEYLIIIQKDGTALRWKKDIFKKTGRHFPQIEEVLKQMKKD